MKVKSESEVASVVSNSVRPRRRQPTRLLCPWDFPGKSTGGGCHCLLLENIRLREINQTQKDKYCRIPLIGGAYSSKFTETKSRMVDAQDWGDEDLEFNGYRVSVWKDENIWRWMVVIVVKLLVTQPCPTLGNPRTVAHQPPLSMEFSRQESTGAGSHSLLQGIFWTQGLNPGLLHCRQILYHLSHWGH